MTAAVAIRRAYLRREISYMIGLRALVRLGFSPTQADTILELGRAR